MLLTLLESILLFVNAIAILNQKRFLKKYGFDTSSAQPGDVNQTVSSKNQIIMMVFTLRSIGKCKSCSYTTESHGNITVNFRMISKLFIQRNKMFYTEMIQWLQIYFQQENFSRTNFMNNVKTLKLLILFLVNSQRFYFQQIFQKPLQQSSNNHIIFSSFQLQMSNTSQRGSRVSSQQKTYPQTYQNSYVAMDPNSSNINSNYHSSYSIPNKYAYTGTNVNTYHHSRMTSNEVSQITGGSRVRQGSVVKGQSRIEYVPYEKKVVDYQTRVYKELVPKTRKVVDYEERKTVQTIPRQVVQQDYIAVEKITQYYKEIIPQKKIQIVPREKKVKRLQYIPVQKQIVHYPQGVDYRNAHGQSRVVLESQGVSVRPDAEYRPMESDLLYRFTSDVQNQQTPVGYVDLGSRRYLSTAPTFVPNNLGYSNVQPFGTTSFIQNSSQPLYQYQPNQVYSTTYLQQPYEQQTLINRMNDSQIYNNVIQGNKYQYRYGDVKGLSSPRSYHENN